MKIRVFVVDDEPSVCETIRAILASAGIESEYSTKSAAAAERLRTEKFDALFLDILMPDPDGIELARRIRAEGINQKTPIVMITGAGDPAVLKQGFEAGANYFLFKPFDRQGLLRLIRATIGFVEREKRRFQRVPLELPVVLAWREQKIVGHTVDIGLGGLLVEAENSLPAGLPVEISIKLPAGKPVKVRGRIVRSTDGNRIGIEFSGLAVSDSERLQEFLLPMILTALNPEGEEKPRR